MCAQGHDALGGREGPTVQLALLRQLPQLPLLLLLEEPPLRQVVLPAQGQPPECGLQVVGARGAWGAWLLIALLIPGEDRGKDLRPAKGTKDLPPHRARPLLGREMVLGDQASRVGSRQLKELLLWG